MFVAPGYRSRIDVEVDRVVGRDAETRVIERAQHVDVVEAVLVRLVDADERRPDHRGDLVEPLLEPVGREAGVAVVARHLVRVRRHVVMRRVHLDGVEGPGRAPVVDELVIVEGALAPVEGLRRRR
jgi:hypothetical protein